MRRIKRGLKLLFFFLIFFAVAPSFAQTDTIRLNLKDAGKRFLENNLYLLAQKYDVDASKALVEQARFWDNPLLSTDQNITDQSQRYFNHRKGDGQVFVQISQVIQTAGKRGKQIKLAEDAGKVKEAEFNDLLRNLRYNLHLDLAQISNLLAQNKILSAEIAAATDLVKALGKSLGSGHSSQKDFLRLKALLFTLQSEKMDKERQILSLQQELKTMLAIDPSAFIQPIIADHVPVAALNPELLFSQAQGVRGDYLANKYALDQTYSELNLQKALAKPDITLGLAYDQNSNYSRHYLGLQLSLPLPLFNRNQGQVHSARLGVQSREMLLKNTELKLKSEIYMAVQRYKLSQQLIHEAGDDFYEPYDAIFRAMLKSFQEKQISLQEFVDFFDSYKETKIKMLQLQLDLQTAIADINYTVGTDVLSSP